MNEAKHYILEFTKKKEYEALKLYLSVKINELHEKMEVVRDPYEIGKLSGCIKILRQLLQLEKEITNM